MIAVSSTNHTKPNTVSEQTQVKTTPVPGTGWSPRPGSPVLGSAGGSGH